MTRRAYAVVVAVAMSAGFAHAALTTDAADVRPAVRCYADGSCTNGYCDPLQDCNAEQYR